MESNSRKPAAAPAMIEHRCRAQVQADHMADATPMTLSEIDADLAIVASIQRQMWNRAHVAKRTGQRESAKELFEQSRYFGRAGFGSN